MSSFLRARLLVRRIVKCYNVLTSTVDVVATSLQRAETDGSLQVDNGRGVGDLFGLGNGGFDRGKVVVTLFDVEHVPAVRLEAGLDVFGKRDVGVAVNGDFCYY